MPFMLNSVHIAGNLTRDVEHKEIGSHNVASFGLAINRRYKGNDGEMKEETTFIEIEVWGRQAELCAQYLSKGRNCMIEGALALDQWEDKQGQKRSKIKVKALRVHFIGGNEQGQSKPSQHQASAQSSGSVSNNMGDIDSPPF